MKLVNFNKLKKFMQMTQSDNEQEALTALRKANAILKEEGVDWERVFGRLVTVEADLMEADVEDLDEPQVARTERTNHQRYVDQLFRDVEAKDPRGRFADFISSLKDQWEEKTWLSPAQLDSLKKAAA